MKGRSAALIVSILMVPGILLAQPEITRISDDVQLVKIMMNSIDSKTLGNTAGGDLNSYATTIQRVMKKYPDAKIVLPGHVAFGGRVLLEHTMELVPQ